MLGSKPKLGQGLQEDGGGDCAISAWLLGNGDHGVANRQSEQMHHAGVIRTCVRLLVNLILSVTLKGRYFYGRGNGSTGMKLCAAANTGRA